MTTDRVVVLNASYQVLAVVSVRRALIYLLKERAELVDAVPGLVFRSTGGAEFPVPRAVRFKTMVKTPFLYRDVAWTREAMFARDNYRCCYCGKTCSHKEATADHVIPKSRNGRLDWKNAVTACRVCNGRKADKTPEEARMPMLYQPRPVREAERLLLAVASTGVDMVALGLAV
jgi:hypothetical protein